MEIENKRNQNLLFIQASERLAKLNFYFDIFLLKQAKYHLWKKLIRISKIQTCIDIVLLGKSEES